jgi:hypothetical protein
MRIDLPSIGKTGVSYYEVQEPTIGQLRKVTNYPSNEILVKNQFILDCSPESEKAKFNKLTACDRDYIFMILVCALNLNKVPCNCICKCGEQIEFAFTLSDHNYQTLDSELNYTTEIFGKEQTFHTLTVGDEIEIVEYALLQPDEDYTDIYETGVVAKTLGRETISDEVVEEMNKLDLAIYYSALFYQFCNFHGVLPVETVTCHACGKKVTSTIPFQKALLAIDLPSIMRSFMAFSSLLDFTSFCQMTVLELQNLKVLIEDRNRAQNG